MYYVMCETKKNFKAKAFVFCIGKKSKVKSEIFWLFFVCSAQKPKARKARKARRALRSSSSELRASSEFKKSARAPSSTSFLASSERASSMLGPSVGTNVKNPNVEHVEHQIFLRKYAT